MADQAGSNVTFKPLHRLDDGTGILLDLSRMTFLIASSNSGSSPATRVRSASRRLISPVNRMTNAMSAPNVGSPPAAAGPGSMVTPRSVTCQG